MSPKSPNQKVEPLTDSPRRPRMPRPKSGTEVFDEHVMVRGLWASVTIFRILALIYAAWSLWHRREEVLHLWVGIALLGVLAAWTIFVTVRPIHRVWAYVTELSIGCLAILGTRLVDSGEVIVNGAKTVPSIWPAAAVAGLAILRGWRGGVAAAALVTAASFVEVVTPTGNTVTNSILVFLLGGCIGYCVDLAREGHEQLRQAMRLEAARAERDRLARTVHDGVLQTLAYINRSGTDLGGQAARLGAMAGEQERILRTLVSSTDLSEVTQAVSGSVDLARLLRPMDDAKVHLIAPAEPVLIERRVADELTAAVTAALDNVAKHAGPEAQAWVLIDDDGEWLNVTIRDSGTGLAEGRLAAAAAEGRLGVDKSIRSRLTDLGGRSTIRSTGRGTVVELQIPSPPVKERA